MADQDGLPVSRRQFFRGVTGDLLRVLGELSGLEQPADAPRVINFAEGDVFVSPERQSAALSDIFGFLEQLKAPDEALPEEPAARDLPTEEHPPEEG